MSSFTASAAGWSGMVDEAATFAAYDISIQLVRSPVLKWGGRPGQTLQIAWNINTEIRITVIAICKGK